MPFAEVNNIRIAYEIYGDGEPLILIHGYSYNKSVWITQIDDLSKLFKIIALDVRGSGESSHPEESYTLDIIVEDLKSVVGQLISQERSAREALAKTSNIQLEDRVYRSYGILSNSRIIESKEAASCLSDVRLGIDMGYIKNISKNILNELMILTQPGFLQQYAGGPLRPNERDIRRASFIRERLKMEN